MRDKRMIIRNCPATYQNFEEKFVCTTQIKQKGFPCYCQDCTDCVMKQIVELCKNNQYPIYNQKLEMIGYEKSPLSKEILQLLDIEEVE